MNTYAGTGFSDRTDSFEAGAEAACAHVFEPFFTAKPTGTGTGLGLSLVHYIVRSQGGTIAVQSAPGEGAAFVMTLPRKVREDAAAGAAASA